jgi:hypothetical protein
VFILWTIILGLAGSALNNDWIRMPESNTIRHTGFMSNRVYTPVQTIQSVQKFSPQHPPLYYIVLSAWYQLTSIHPVLLRILSLYFALLTTAFTYRMGCYVDRKWGGLIALYLITFSAYHIFYAHEIRNYTILAFSSVVLMWTYWRVIASKDKVHITKWLWLYVASVWCVYVHYFGVFALLGIGIYHLLFFQKTRRWLQVAGVEILAGLTFLPWLPIFIHGMTSRKSLVSDSQNLIETLYYHLFIYSNGLWWLAIGLISVAIWRLWIIRHKLTIHRYIMMVGLVMLLGMVLLNEVTTVIPIERMRYTMVWLPQIILMLTVGIVSLARYRRLQMLILVGWGVAFVLIHQTPEYLDYTGMADQGSDQYADYMIMVDMENRLPGEGETVVTVNHDVWVFQDMLDYYELLTDYSFLHLTDDFSEFDIDMGQFLINQMKRVKRSYSFWVLTAPQYTDLETVDMFQQTTSDSFRPCLTTIDTATAYLAYYVRDDIPCDLVSEPVLPKIQYDNDLKLLNTTLQQQDNTLTIYSWWDDKPVDPYGFSIQLFDENNNKVLQGDFFLPPETIQVSNLDISSLAPDEYQVSLILYDVSTQSSVSGYAVSSDTQFERIWNIGTIKLQ